MAAGDLAAAQAGFVPALSSDDLRLGFGKIDEAADLAFRYGPLSFTSATALLAYTGAAPYQRAVDRASGDEYRWNGTAWKLWNTGWRSAPSAYAGIAGASGASPGWVNNYAQYRYASGRVCCRYGLLLNGGTAAVTGRISWGLPVPAAVKDSAQDNRAVLSSVKAIDVSAGQKEYTLHATLGGTGYDTVYLAATGDVSGGMVPTGPTVPFTWAQSDALVAVLEYDSL